MTYFITASVFFVIFIIILFAGWFLGNILAEKLDYDYCCSWIMSSTIAAIAIVYALFEKGLLIL